MKERLIQMLNADSSFGKNKDIAMYEFGLSREKHYDVLVVAPGWKPTKIMADYDVEITCTKEHSYISGYEVRGDDFLIGWIQCSTGASSLIDELSTCAYLAFDKMVFVGAVGSLVPEIGLGTLCTPEWSISGNLANGYLMEDIREYKPFGRVYPNDPAFVQQVLAHYPDMIQAPVFCTDSIFCEYSHLDFIKCFGARLIEMETSSFYLMADLMEKPAIALMAVSDNSANGDPLVGRTEEQKRLYNITRKQVIPKMIMDIARMRRHHEMKEFESEHYIFHYGANTKAEQDIEEIASYQESCFRYICGVLGVTPDFKIEYYLCDSPEEVGRIYGDNDPCNGFADLPDKIYAVYNEQVQCIGFHEDAHIISFTINRPPYPAITEGLAMYFDRKWWGIQNLDWTGYFLKTGRYVPVDKMLDRECFFEHDCSISYPIMGAFTDWLISTFGAEKYMTMYKQKNIAEAMFFVYQKTPEELNRAFVDYVQLFGTDEVLELRMDNLMKEYEEHDE